MATTRICFPYCIAVSIIIIVSEEYILFFIKPGKNIKNFETSQGHEKNLRFCVITCIGKFASAIFDSDSKIMPKLLRYIN